MDDAAEVEIQYVDINEVRGLESLISKTKTMEEFKAIMAAKNEKIRAAIEAGESWSVAPSSPICPACKGAGQKFIFQIGEEEITCPSCGGRGIRTDVCAVCGGRAGEVETCSRCNGTGVYVHRKNRFRADDVPCPKCKGAGKCTEPVLGRKIKSSRDCPTCLGSGIELSKVRIPLALKKEIRASGFEI